MMKIISIEIIGYGKWTHKTFDNIQSFQMFCGANEAGKSTVIAFIHSILFGFPTKQQSTLRMEPKNKGAYGGRIKLINTPLGSVTIERLRGKATGDVTIYAENGKIWGEEKLISILSQMDRTTYEAIFSFNIHNLQQIEQMKQADFEKYLLVTSANGSDQLFKISQQLQKQMEQLFKPSGRNPEINRQLEQTKSAQKAYIEAKKKNANYETLVKSYADLSKQLDEYQEEKNNLQLHISELQSLEKNWELLEEWAGLKKIINSSEEIRFPPDGLLRLEHILTNEIACKNEKTQLEERQSALKKKFAIQKQQFSDTKIGKIEDILENWPHYIEKEKIQNELEKEYHNLKQEEIQTKQNYDFSSLTVGRSNFSYQVEANIKTLKQEQDQLNLKKKELEWQIAANKKEEIRIQKQIDLYESEMWPKEKWKHVKEMVNAKSVNKSYDWFFLMSIILTTAIILLGIFQSSSLYFGFALLVLLTGVISKYKSYLKKDSAYSDTEVMEYLKQQQLRNAWQSCFAEMDEIALAISNQKKEQTTLSRQADVLQKKVAAIYSGFSLKQTSPHFEDELFTFRDWLVLKQKQKQNLNKQKEIQNDFNDFKAKLQEISSLMNLTEEQIPMQIAELKQQIRQFNDSTAWLAKNEEKQEQLTNRLDLVTKELMTLEKKKQELFEYAATNTEAEYRELGTKYKEQQMNKERLVLLSAQIPEEKRQEFSKYSRARDLKREIMSLHEKINKLDMELKKGQQKQAELKHEIHILEEGGTFKELVQHYYNEKTELQEQTKEWFTLKIAQGLLEKALKYVQEEKYPRALHLASSYFNLLTHNTYKRVHFEKERIQVVRAGDDFVFLPEELSQATKEQLYLAIRFALIESIEDTYPFPIIIDDSFVNFDKERLAQIMVLLSERKQKNQIIFFTCHSELSKYFSSEEKIMLY